MHLSKERLSGKLRLVHVGAALILAGLFSTGGSCDSPTGPNPPHPRVSGHVYDSLTGLPIDSARVSASPDSLGAEDPRVDYSDSTGSYTIYLVNTGWNNVRCTKPGYVTDSLRVYYGGSIVNDSVDFRLVPE